MNKQYIFPHYSLGDQTVFPLYLHNFIALSTDRMATCVRRKSVPTETCGFGREAQRDKLGLFAEVVP